MFACCAGMEGRREAQFPPAFCRVLRRGAAASWNWQRWRADIANGMGCRPSGLRRPWEVVIGAPQTPMAHVIVAN